MANELSKSGTDFGKELASQLEKTSDVNVNILGQPEKRSHDLDVVDKYTLGANDRSKTSNAAVSLKLSP